MVLDIGFDILIPRIKVGCQEADSISHGRTGPVK